MLPEFQCPHIQRSIFAVEEILVPVKCLHGDRIHGHGITAADAVSRRYKSNDPEAIIAQRAIKIKDIRFCEELLGFYTVLLNCEYIGINKDIVRKEGTTRCNAHILQ